MFYFFPSAKFLNTASRCHFHLQCAQCTVFNSTDEQNSLQIHTFSGKGHSSSPDPTSIAAYGASILSLRHSTCDPPNVPVALTPMRGKPVFNTVQCPDAVLRATPATTIKSAMVTYIKTICLAFEICGAQGCIYLQPPLSSYHHILCDHISVNVGVNKSILKRRPKLDSVHQMHQGAVGLCIFSRATIC